MNEQLEKKLQEDFPLLARTQVAYDETDPASWVPASFWVGDGWEPLIRRAFEKIEALRPTMDPELASRLCVAQVKEKFGGLRLYMNWDPDGVSEILREAEAASYKTCETCGTTDGVTTEGGWLRTLCTSCRTERERRRGENTTGA